MEVCVDSLESVVAAYDGNADRVELCSSLNEGGLTPSLGLLKAVQRFNNSCDINYRKPLVLNCMIRCRVGDFCYSETEIETMKEDLKKFVEMNVDGLVFGALTPEGMVDEDLMAEFLNEIPKNDLIKTTFHRAFDVCADWRTCFKQIENLGFNKILTSGQEKTAYEGRHLIKELVELSEASSLDGNKVVQIIAGAGINKTNLRSILYGTRCHEFHASCRSSRPSRMKFRNANITMGSPHINEFEINYTDRAKCKELVDIYRTFTNS